MFIEKIQKLFARYGHSIFFLKSYMLNRLGSDSYNSIFDSDAWQIERASLKINSDYDSQDILTYFVFVSLTNEFHTCFYKPMGLILDNIYQDTYNNLIKDVNMLDSQQLYLDDYKTFVSQVKELYVSHCKDEHYKLSFRVVFWDIFLSYFLSEVIITDKQNMDSDNYGLDANNMVDVVVPNRTLSIIGLDIESHDRCEINLKNFGNVSIGIGSIKIESLTISAPYLPKNNNEDLQAIPYKEEDDGVIQYKAAFLTSKILSLELYYVNKYDLPLIDALAKENDTNKL